jgi:hypothetical protein
LPPDSLKYSTSRLQSRLEKYYDESILIQTQQGQGQSNIVFSSSLSIGDAIKPANQLKCDLKFAQLQTQIDQSPPMLSDDQTLHAAVRILRKDIYDMDFSNTYYPTSDAVSLSYSMQLMPFSLTKFLYWLIDNKSHREAEIEITSYLEKMRKYLAIAETIVSRSKNSFPLSHRVSHSIVQCIWFQTVFGYLIFSWLLCFLR